MHETETKDVIYCQECGYEGERILDKPRLLKPAEHDPIPAGWSWDKGQKESHPAHKGHMRKKQEGKKGRVR